ncbi:MAG TPA: STN and carboxypeptidase regulatory-like domain-containing protein [Flavitalea sp.]|nr:STN and carboxypeptidase regulatory-like domain-containing protein [Flavitalea sp.]
MTQLNRVLKRTSLLFILTVCAIFCPAQNILNKTISLQVTGQPLNKVLEMISNKGNFYFSYNSTILKKDSLVTLSITDKSVQQVLQQLFSQGYDFKESGNYIIITRVPVKISVITTKSVSEDKIYTVVGYVLDETTRSRLSDASIYEKRLLASALTNENGYFKIRLKSRYKTAELTVSKEFYEDTTVVIQPKYNQELTIYIQPVQQEDPVVTVGPQDFYAPDSLKLSFENDSSTTEYTYVKTDSVKVEKTAFGDFFISSKQKIQSLNLGKFFIERPFQVSLTPGLSSHGKLNAQIVNNFSLNIFGGYSGGLKGAEIGGLFNMNKKDVNGFQVGGLFNLTGGNVDGAQIGGIHNTVLGGFTGWQVGGITNFVKGKFNGWQIGGIYNHVADSLDGFQLGGILNYADKGVNGLQIGGIGNVSRLEMKGLQVGGIFNYAKKMRGVQIGLINVADTSDGVSIGLLNISRNGYHKLSLYSNEVLNTNLALKTGNSNLYSILIGGINIDQHEKAYSFGFGLGHDFIFSKTFSLSLEGSAQYIYLGSFDYVNILSRLSPSLNVHLSKSISLFAGPAFNVYYSDQSAPFPGYKKNIPPSHYHIHETDNPYVNGWIGWNAGIIFF